jgi:hypothetical protein
MRIRTAGRHRARHSENGMPKESIALRGGRCDSPMIQETKDKECQRGFDYFL